MLGVLGLGDRGPVLAVEATAVVAVAAWAGAAAMPAARAPARAVPTRTLRSLRMGDFLCVRALG